MDTEPLFCSITVRNLFEGEWWWTVRRYEDQSLYDFGINSDRKEALAVARESADRLRKEIQNG